MITKIHIPTTDIKLGRHINHDSRSLNYIFHPRAKTITSVTQPRHIGILDQGQIGSCTGNAGIGALATDPLFSTMNSSSKYSLNESGALKLYSDAETIDGDGPYPPNDNGSSGLSIAKALKTAGLISSYQHVFNSNSALLSLAQYPILFGTYWYSAMFTPDTDGRVHPSGTIVGGHEIVARQIDAPNQRIWFDNSWGTSWGVQGRFYLTFADFNTLMQQQGDIIVLIPTTTAPAPTPPPTADQILAAAMKTWLAAKGL